MIFRRQSGTTADCSGAVLNHDTTIYRTRCFVNDLAVLVEFNVQFLAEINLSYEKTIVGNKKFRGQKRNRLRLANNWKGKACLVIRQAFWCLDLNDDRSIHD